MRPSVAPGVRPRKGRVAAERQARIREARARLDSATPKPRMDRPGPGRYSTRDEGHAREAQPRDRRTRTDRDRDAIADVGMYRAVSYTDIAEQHYDGHPYVARRAVLPRTSRPAYATTAQSSSRGEDHARERDTHSHNRNHFPGQASSTSAGRIFSWLRTLQLFATTPLGSEHFLQYSQHLGHGRGRKPSKPLR